MNKVMTSQRNDLYWIIDESPFSLTDFTRSEESDDFSNPSLEFRYKSSEYYFRILPWDEAYDCNFSPGLYSIFDEIRSSNWKEIRGFFRNWLHYLEREVHEPDLWDNLEKLKFIYGGKPGEDFTNDNFSMEQIGQLSATIEGLKSHIQDQFELPPEKLEVVNEKLDYLVEAAGRMGQFDWMNATYGALFSLVAGSIISFDNMKTIIAVLAEPMTELFRISF